MSNPIAVPLNAATTIINAGVAKPSQTPAASKNAQSICADCVRTRIERFGYKSASEPPHTDENNIGAEPRAATTPSKSFEFVRS